MNLRTDDRRHVPSTPVLPEAKHVEPVRVFPKLGALHHTGRWAAWAARNRTRTWLAGRRFISFFDMITQHTYRDIDLIHAQCQDQAKINRGRIDEAKRAQYQAPGPRRSRSGPTSAFSRTDGVSHPPRETPSCSPRRWRISAGDTLLPLPANADWPRPGCRPGSGR